MEYLGLLLDGETLCIDPSKIAGIAKWPRVLKSVKEVRSTLGILRYHRAFIPGFVDITRPLLNLLKKGVPFVWTPECTAALNCLITLTTTDPVLWQPDHNKPFKLEVDASQFAMGAILYQRDSDGLRHPVGCDSSSLTETERNYPIWDRKFLAIICALEHWCYLLLGAKFIVDVFTNHKNLQYYRSPQKINCCLARYILTLGDYNIHLLHKPGASNRADALSRHPDHDTGTHDNDRVLALLDGLFLNAITTTDLDDSIIAAQATHAPLLSQWANTYSLLQHANSSWWNGSRLVDVADNSLRKGVTSLYHDSTTAGHPGVLKTCLLLAKDYWWPHMKGFVSSFIRGCATCQATKVNMSHPRVPHCPITTDRAALPFDTITMDLIVKLPLSNSFDSILTVMDHDCSKAAIFIPCHETATTFTIANLYVQHVFPHYGTPCKIITDRDTRFTSHFPKELCRILDIKQNISTAYHPETDGQSEQTNQWLEQYLRIFVDHRQTTWH